MAVVSVPPDVGRRGRSAGSGVRSWPRWSGMGIPIASRVAPDAPPGSIRRDGVRACPTPTASAQRARRAGRASARSSNTSTQVGGRGVDLEPGSAAAGAAQADARSTGAGRRRRADGVSSVPIARASGRQRPARATTVSVHGLAAPSRDHDLAPIRPLQRTPPRRSPAPSGRGADSERPLAADDRIADR